MSTTFHQRWAESFLCAGSSALLIAVPRICPQLWFFSLFALVPFLWRVTGVSFRESLPLGGLLALSYAFVAFRITSWTLSAPHLLTLIGLLSLFGLYAALVNAMKKHIGLNAIFVAALWLPVEYIINHFLSSGYVLAIAPDESGLVLRFSSLFGLLMVSFAVVIINTLILATVAQILRSLRSRDTHTKTRPIPIIIPAKERLSVRNWYCFPDVRAPPLGIFDS